MSNKAINKFAKFTATKTPLYKYNRLGTTKPGKLGVKNEKQSKKSEM